MPSFAPTIILSSKIASHNGLSTKSKLFVKVKVTWKLTRKIYPTLHLYMVNLVSNILPWSSVLCNSLGKTKRLNICIAWNTNSHQTFEILVYCLQTTSDWLFKYCIAGYFREVKCLRFCQNTTIHAVLNSRFHRKSTLRCSQLVSIVHIRGVLNSRLNKNNAYSKNKKPGNISRCTLLQAISVIFVPLSKSL